MSTAVSPSAETEPALITPEERARRQAEVDYGRGTVRLEGFVLSAAVEDLSRRYIKGELTSEELTDLILAHCNS